MPPSPVCTVATAETTALFILNIVVSSMLRDWAWGSFWGGLWGWVFFDSKVHTLDQSWTHTVQAKLKRGDVKASCGG